MAGFGDNKENIDNKQDAQEVFVIKKTWVNRFYELPLELQNTFLCESDQDKDGLPDIDAQNPYSSASGIIQLIDGTFAWVWKEIYDTPVDWSKKNDPDIQLEIGLWLYERYGLSQWEYPCGTLNMPIGI